MLGIEEELRRKRKEAAEPEEVETSGDDKKCSDRVIEIPAPG